MKRFLMTLVLITTVVSVCLAVTPATNTERYGDEYVVDFLPFVAPTDLDGYKNGLAPVTEVEAPDFIVDTFNNTSLSVADDGLYMILVRNIEKKTVYMFVPKERTNTGRYLMVPEEIECIGDSFAMYCYYEIKNHKIVAWWIKA